MALLKTVSKPIGKRKPRRIYKLKTTLGEYMIAKEEHISKQKAQTNENQGDGSALVDKNEGGGDGENTGMF